MEKLFPSPHTKTILGLSLPAIAGLSAQMLVSVVDAAMVGRLNNADYALAAMGLSVLATWALVSFFSSLSTGTHLLIARKYGQKNFNACSEVLYNSIVIAIALGFTVCVFGMATAHTVAQIVAKDNKVGELAGEFMFYRMIGLPFFLITVSFRGFYFGIGQTRIFMISALIVNILNVLFNYAFIFGKFGLPALGVAGSGLGSSLATICDAAYYVVISTLPSFRKKYRFLSNLRLNKVTIASIFRISLPVSFQHVFILTGFLSFVAITGLIGIPQQAATQAVISLLFVSFLPCYGFGIAVQTLVGNMLGEGKMDMARLYGFLTAKIATVYTSILGLLLLLFPRAFLWIITEDHKIIEIAVPALRIAAIAQISYGIGIILANALQALGKTKYVMFAEVLTNFFLLVPLSYFFGIYFNYGIGGAWSSLPFYIIAYSIIVFYKFSSATRAES